jgi:hypothetical protein
MCLPIQSVVNLNQIELLNFQEVHRAIDERRGTRRTLLVLATLYTNKRAYRSIPTIVAKSTIELTFNISDQVV